MARKFSELFAKMSPEAQAEVDRRVQQTIREMRLQELRQSRNVSQVSVADDLETTQSSVSKLERRSDVYVSTLRRYIESLGGELEIFAHFPDGSVRINQFEELGDVARVRESFRSNKTSDV